MKSETQEYLKTHGPLSVPSAKTALYLALLSVVIIVLSTTGIGDEGTVSLGGDMQQHLMNGAYFYDLIRDLPVTNFIEYTLQYHLRYPALSLGHHPVLLGIAEAPFYFIFGISVLSGRLTILFFMLLGTFAWFMLIRSQFDEDLAFFSSLLFVTNPYIVLLSRIVMSEIPVLALIFVATYFFFQYLKSDKKYYAYAFAGSFVLSVYAKHLAIFMLPAYLFYFLSVKGMKRLIAKEVIISCVIIVLLISPLVPITLKFSQVNVSYTQKAMATAIKSGMPRMLRCLEFLWERLLTVPVFILSLVGILIAILRRDIGNRLFLLWIISYYIFGTYMRAIVPRYLIYWVPAFSFFAASVLNLLNYQRWKIFVSIVLTVIGVYQFALAFESQPQYASGYEEAAKYVVDNRRGESVLFHGMMGTRLYFIFFVRKHDPDRELIVLRADKMLVSKGMDVGVAKRIEDREKLYGLLNDFGTGYVVIEERKVESNRLQWLREEVESKGFELSKRIPIVSNDHRLEDASLAVYSYKGYTAPNLGKILRIDIPAMGDSISVRLGDLMRSK